MPKPNKAQESAYFFVLALERYPVAIPWTLPGSLLVVSFVASQPSTCVFLPILTGFLVWPHAGVFLCGFFSFSLYDNLIYFLPLSSILDFLPPPPTAF